MTTNTKSPHGNLKLNDGMIAALSEAIAKGNYIYTACNLCGITDACFRQWRDRAEQDDTRGLTEDESLYLRLFTALKKAEAEAESKLVDVVRKSAVEDKQWLPAMTFLERRHPDRWGRRDRIQGGNTYNINIEKALIDATGKLEDGLDKLAARLENVPQITQETQGEPLPEGDTASDTD